jgi:outer membrane receptor protein involved in Fe transport
LDQISNFQKVDSLTYYAENNYFYNRIGSSIRYSNKGLNATIGLAAQQINNKYSFYKNQNGSLIIAPIDKMYQHLLPNVNINYQLPKNTHLSVNYSYNVQAPSQSDLLPTPIITSILYKKEGNPNLKPELSHDISLNLNKWNPASFSSVGVYSSYSRNDENIVYNQTIKNIDSIGLVTTIVPMNYKGGQSGYFYLWTNFPIVKTKLAMNINASSSASERPEFINDVLNKTTNLSYSFSSYFFFTPTQKLVFGLQGSISDNYSTFSINTEQNQKRSTLGCSSSIKWQFLKKFFFESNFDFTNYQNDKIAIDQKIPLWNASLRRQLGKKNRVEIRLAVFDIFNKNVVFDQNFYGNHFTITKSPTLARYFMLSFSYNLKGFSDKLKEN